jgi:hypothetical protein
MYAPEVAASFVSHIVKNSLKLHKLTYRNVLHTGSGLYECQISTITKLSQ